MSSINDAAENSVTLERILDAAEEAFAREGYEGTSLRDIERSLEPAEPRFYDHVEGKEQLYAAVIGRGVGPVLHSIAETFGQGREPAEAVPEIIQSAMQGLGLRPRVAHIIQREALTGGGHLTPLLTEIIAPVVAVGGKMASHDIEESGWDDDEIPHIVLTMAQAVLGFFTMGSLVRELSGLDLMTDEARERHTRFLIELTARVFPTPGRGR